MIRASKPTRQQRQHYEKLVGCVIVRVLWDKLNGAPLPVLILSTPGGGTVECTVMTDPGRHAPGYLDHDI